MHVTTTVRNSSSSVPLLKSSSFHQPLHYMPYTFMYKILVYAFTKKQKQKYWCMQIPHRQDTNLVRVRRGDQILKGPMFFPLVPTHVCLLNGIGE